MSLTEEQHATRLLGVGASEVASVLGLSPFGGALEVYLAKVEGWRKEETTDMERGQFLEPAIAAWYAKREAVELREVGTIRHPSLPLLATPDRVATTSAGLNRLVEIKAPRRGDGWENGEAPEHYIVQVWATDAVLTAAGWSLDPVSHLVGLVDGDLAVREVPRDAEIQAEVVARVAVWWRAHVETKTPPPLDGSDAASAWLRRRFPGDRRPIRAATLEEDLALQRLRAVEATKDAAEQAYAVARQVVEEAIGDAGGLEASVGRVTWKASKKGVRTFLKRWSKEAAQ